jgi:hypothetical protein
MANPPTIEELIALASERYREPAPENWREQLPSGIPLSRRMLYESQRSRSAEDFPELTPQRQIQPGSYLGDILGLEVLYLLLNYFRVCLLLVFYRHQLNVLSPQ